MRQVRVVIESMTKSQRMLYYGVMAYALNFVVGTIAGIATGVEFDAQGNVAQTNFSDLTWLVGFAGIALVTLIVARWYFATVIVPPGVKEGILFGVMMVGLSILIDSALLTLLASSLADVSIDTIMEYFTHPVHLFYMLTVIVVSAMVGFNEAKRRPAHVGNPFPERSEYEDHQ